METLSDDGTKFQSISEHPHVQRMRLRAKLERVVDKLLAAMDAIDGAADLEPALGFSEPSRPDWMGGLSQLHIGEGATDGREDEHDGREPPEDDEHTLGSAESESLDQSRMPWPQDDGEPSLGSLHTMDQTRWAAGGDPRLIDHEVQCEDEGAQCEDEGHDSDTELDHADYG